MQDSTNPVPALGGVALSKRRLHRLLRALPYLWLSDDIEIREWTVAIEGLLRYAPPDALPLILWHGILDHDFQDPLPDWPFDCPLNDFFDRGTRLHIDWQRILLIHASNVRLGSSVSTWDIIAVRNRIDRPCFWDRRHVRIAIDTPHPWELYTLENAHKLFPEWTSGDKNYWRARMAYFRALGALLRNHPAEKCSRLGSKSQDRVRGLEQDGRSE